MIEIIPNWHPLFVHFTVALLPVATAAYLLSLLLPQGDLSRQLALVARWNLRIGMGITLLTVAAGWYAYNTVRHDEPAHIVMTEHRNLALLTFLLFLGAVGWEYALARRNTVHNWLLGGLLLVATSLLASTAWHGGELVYRHGLGVMSLPKAEAEGHHHHHDGDEALPDHDHALEADHDAMHEEDGHIHDETAHDMPAHGEAVSAVMESVSAPAGHTHPPGTPPHQD